MHLLQSDIEEISAWVIARLQERQIDLAETARVILINKAIGHWRQYGREAMEQAIAWEINLIPAVKRTSDRDIFICLAREMRNLDPLVSYLKSIGCELMLDKGRYYTVCPKSYTPGAVKKRIEYILNGGAKPKRVR